MKWDAGKLGFCLSDWELLASTVSCPWQRAPFSFTYSLAQLQLYGSEVLSAERAPKRAGLFGEQSLRKETVSVNSVCLFICLFNVAPL